MLSTPRTQGSHASSRKEDDSGVHCSEAQTILGQSYNHTANLSRHTASYQHRRGPSLDAELLWDTRSSELGPLLTGPPDTSSAGKSGYVALPPESSSTSILKSASRVQGVTPSEQEDFVNARQADFDATARNWCFAGLALALCTAFAAIAGGVVSYTWKSLFFGTDKCIGLANGLLTFDTAHGWYIIAQLLVIILTTALNESIGFAHTVAHRWSLFEDGRLSFHTNLRLLSASKSNFANRWYSNVLNSIYFVLSYSAAAQVFGDVSILSLDDFASSCEDSGSHFSFNFRGSIALILGVALIIQIVIAALAVYGARSTIRTWSSNPVNAALASSSGLIRNRSSPSVRHLVRIPRRSMIGSSRTSQKEHLKEHSPVASEAQALLAPALPRRLKYNMSSCSKRATRIVCLLWATCVGTLIWAICIIALSMTRKNWGGTGLQSHAMVESFPNLSINQSQIFFFSISTIVQTPLTLALYTTELLVNTTRDEVSWSKMKTVSGGSLETNAIKGAFTSWITAVLFGFKTLVHFFFGEAVTLQTQAAYTNTGTNRIFAEETMIIFSATSIFALTGTTFLLALFGTYLARRRLKGPQPETYGHLQTLVNLIDDYGRPGEALFWGDKGVYGSTNIAGEVSSGQASPDKAPVRYAGTSAKKELVGAIQMDALYS